MQKKQCKFFLFLSLILTIASRNSSVDLEKNDEKSLRFLDDQLKNSNTVVTITCEFPFSCGNGYINSKKICNDIFNEIKKRSFDFKEILQPKNISLNKRDFSKDEFFNIFITKNNRNFLLATTNTESEVFNQNLVGYPAKFYTGFGVPNDKDFTQKFNLIESLVEGILNAK